MAAGVIRTLAALLAALVLASCRQDAATQDGGTAQAPDGDAAVLALLKARYGAPARLKGPWTQRLDDQQLAPARQVQRALCADRGITLAGGRYRMLAVCTRYADATPVELGVSDFIVLHEAADGSVGVATELSGRASGGGGQPGAISILQVGAGAWAYQIDEERVVVGSRMRDRSWLVFDGGDAVAEAGWLRAHLDDQNAIDCVTTGRCRPGTLDLDFDARPDDSQPSLRYWPLRVHESGTGCAGKVDALHAIAYDPAQSRYLIPSRMQLEACD